MAVYKLKPCPFCGNTVGINVASTKCRSSEPHADMYHGEVWHYCGAMYMGVSLYDLDAETARERAIAEWNKRSEPVQSELFGGAI